MSVLYDVEGQIRRHTFFDLDHKYVVNNLWIAGTRFLMEDAIKVFDAFPMLAFMSPEPDSGKSRALKVTELLSKNALSAGSYTPASLLAKIDNSDGMVTICMDEIDTVFAHGKDNTDLIRLFNLGYERGATIVRCKRFADGTFETPAYCPKAFAGLKIAKIPGPTKTRTIIINMRPKTNEDIMEYIDKDELQRLNARLDEWARSPETLERIRNVCLPQSDISFLNNRDAQIWKPLLVIAKSESEEWYQRILASARFFTMEQSEKKDLTHTILLAIYRVFRTGYYSDKIHTFDLLNELHDLGIPKWIEAGALSDYLSAYDEQIRPRQMKIEGLNRNGYDWHTFLATFKAYITPKEIEEVERQLGIIQGVA